MSRSIKSTDNNNTVQYSSPNSKKKEYRERLLEERKSLVSALLDQSSSYDKWILTLASGALALSLTFIEKIAPHPQTQTIYYLVGAWSSFGLSMLMTLLSFLFSQKACLKNIEIIEKRLNNNNSPTSNNFTILTNILNWLSMAFFLVGVAFLIVFAVYNVSSLAGG
jgi:uncharacterized membrane protein YhaH (DUF805 family)